jgi:hypothetical protein
MVDPETSQEFSSHVVARLENDQAAGQSFTLRQKQLQGIALWLRTEQNAHGSVTLRLFGDNGDSTPAASIIVAQNAIASGGTTYFLFSERDLDRQTWFFTLEATGSPVEVLGRQEDAYPDGALYQVVNGELAQVNADMAFRVSYEYGWAALTDDLFASLPHLWLILPLVGLLLLPGWLLLDMLNLRTGFDLGEQIALSVGMSLAMMPLALLWITTANLQCWQIPTFLWVFVILVQVVICRYAIRWARQPKISHWNPINLQTAALLSIFVLSLLVRFAMIRGMAAPAWVDSVHHATITRLIVEQGQFPPNYLPYLNVEAQEYHAGFHAGLAAFTMLSKLDIAQAMLIYGQVLNALIVFAVYALGKFLTQNSRAGLIAALIAGLLTPMPAYYTSWGRYTQMAGLLILPAIVILFQGLIEKGKNKAALWWASAIAAGGLFLVHYRVAAFAGLLLLTMLASAFRWDRAHNGQLIAKTVGWGLVVGGLAFGLAFPWVWPTLTNVFAPIVAGGGQTSELFGDFSWNYLTAAMGSTALALAWVGFIWGVVRGQRWAAALAMWLGLLLLMANLGPLGMPGGAIFSNNTAVTIMFFMPIAILGGYAVSQAYETGRGWWPERWRRTLQWGLSILLIGLAFAGSQKLLPILRPSTMLFRQADYPALAWISNHIPPDETVLINPFLWGYNLYAGNDGGFWISPLAGRKTVPPPVLYGLSSAKEIIGINMLCQQVTQNGENAAALWDILQAEEIQYVYIGGRGGPISARELNASPLFEARYQNNGTWVFQTKSAK